ncbi:MAG: hypothetical protein RBR10_06135 [Bacteroidales bacterium]|nr:hypothetical protein [Bacteroidales bacterium]
MTSFSRLTYYILILSASCFMLSCKQDIQLEGYYEGSLRFSEHEIMFNRLWLNTDSSFFYLSQPDEDDDWHAFGGNWSIQDGKLFLDGSALFKLWMELKEEQLEVLDYAGNMVIGDKHLTLSKAVISPAIDMDFIATGAIYPNEELPMFRLCGSEKKYPLYQYSGRLSDSSELIPNKGSDLEYFVMVKLKADDLSTIQTDRFSLKLIEVLSEANPCE